MSSIDLTAAFDAYAANSDPTKWSPGPASPLSKPLAIQDIEPPAGQDDPPSPLADDGNVRLLSYINGARGSGEGDLPASLTTDEALALPIAGTAVVATEPVRRLRRSKQTVLEEPAARDPDESLEGPIASDEALAPTETEKKPRFINYGKGNSRLLVRTSRRRRRQPHVQLSVARSKTVRKPTWRVRVQIRMSRWLQRRRLQRQLVPKRLQKLGWWQLATIGLGPTMIGLNRQLRFRRGLAGAKKKGIALGTALQSMEQQHRREKRQKARPQSRCVRLSRIVIGARIP